MTETQTGTGSAAAEAPRYALYWTPPPASALARFGNAWLGRDPARGMALERPPAPGMTQADIEEITAEARRYGFHATLKPPFRLAQGRTLAELRGALQDFAAGRRAFAAGQLAIRELGGFVALMPEGDTAPLHAFAADVVRAFDGFRAPAPPDEVQRRREGGLNARQEDLLAQWGYPYVLDEFRFHMTLTARLNEAGRAMVAEALAPLLAPVLAEPLTIESIALFEEPAPGAEFREIGRYEFAD
jgi:putative phosphonate metabolism protein